ncbi:MULTISPECIES: signal recognition particle-docking protein FtsY [unclassified Pseudomonas]|uniref:signal recognition particle-docking protein FtsY n=1 Tax=unclassified Pseudomonas TaxID=196821 RepID=UPI00257ABA74|nr:MULTISPECIES: signal recognition particle-docking protein FtsY [unclassified Pseudomonas]
MFGSDDKKSPPAGEKKGFFSWFRKKPQETTEAKPETAVEPVVHPEPVPEPADAIPSTQLPPAEETETPAPVAEQDESVEAFQPEPIQAQPVEPPRQPETVQPSLQAPAVEPEPEPAMPAPVEPVFIEPERLDESRTAELQPVAEPEPEPEPEPVAEPVVSVVEPEPELEAEPESEPELAPQPAAQTKLGFFARLKQGLSKTSASIGEGMASLFLGKKAIDDDLLDELETRLLMADVGVEATTTIMKNLTQRVARKQLADSEALYQALQEELTGLLTPVELPLAIDKSTQPFVILVVGVNGVGKTTTIGKLAKKLQLEGKKVMLAAGDTFRAAAVEQLQVWGERNRIPVIAQHTGADSASVIYDAVQAAKARGIDVLIADTAGRLHTKDNLMEELRKVRRVIGKLDESAPHETLLVLDAGTGQNAMNQAKQFHAAVPLSGLALTKLDGTAKGGVIFALAKQMSLPIRYIGVGEGIDDLREFEAKPFVRALFAERETT